MWSTDSPIYSSIRHPLGAQLVNSEFLRRYARRLLRDARSDEPSRTLPVLRRIVAARVTPEIRLTELHTVRATLQLKHVLHALARELGFASWESCKHEIDDRPPAMLDRYRLELGMFGDYEQNWFADEQTAVDWQRQNGGYLVRVGRQVVASLA
ncbi:MAG TPA: hypothetical protein VN019_00025 [Oxalicibacterium sp.]|nr:hypothetical protein [Oxalicibacterium sp.]